MATTRLRKAFRYPSEDDDLDEPDELDEEHQERLIADLQQQDAEKNALYRKAFLAIPLLGAAFFIYTFVVASTARQRLIAVLSVSSLAFTAYILHFTPIKAPERKGKKAVYQIEADKGPVEKYLVYLNAGLAGLLLLAAALSWRKGSGEDAWREALPGSMYHETLRSVCEISILTDVTVIFGLTMIVRQHLAPLDLEELHKARYGYKGA